MPEEMNILFTCVGRRVSLLKSFRKAAERLGVRLGIIGTEVTQLSSGLQLCDERHIVEAVESPNYIGQLLDICRRSRVKLVIPTTDLDLKVLAVNKSRFDEIGSGVLISSPKVVDICRDKRKTFQFLSDSGFDTPDTMSADEALCRDGLVYPLFLKPWDGFGSRGTAKVADREELEVFAKRIPNCIVQEYVGGVEYTCDVFVDFAMSVRTVVPRRRIEIRAGEVSKGQTVRHDQIMSRSRDLVRTLGAGPGVITIQLITGDNGHIRFIEINPRFGGGVPLSIEAGADFPGWILEELMGRQPEIRFGDFAEDLVMLRYDDEVWVRGLEQE
jgi:carbamoyl-phosphate synthase large subunit